MSEPTPRQLDFLAAWFQCGGSNTKAARRLMCSPQVVRNVLMHLRRIEGATTNMLLAMGHMDEIQFRDVLPVGTYQKPRTGLTPAEALEKRRERYQLDPEYRDRVKRLARQGMRNHRGRAAQYQALVDLYGEQCGICGRSRSIVMGPDKVTRRLAIDHDHTTEAIRGLLCTQCNMMLGYAGDRPETLEAGADYLRRHAAQQNMNAAEAERESA